MDPGRALAARPPATSGAWSARDVILYHFGIGAGELRHLYERDLVVLPGFAVIPVQEALTCLGSIPGLVFDRRLMLHGEHEIELRRPVPAAATVTTAARVAALWDKGDAALAVVETSTRDEAGEVLFVNRFSLFLRGAGGFGGEPGPPAADHTPAREPDHVVRSVTVPWQAALYRLSGDRNRLHIDPEIARKAGFERPILHGLCTYGIVCRSVVDALLGGDPSAVRGYRARFAGVVHPGETIVTSMWREGDRVLVEAEVEERRAKVISHAVVTLE